MGRLFRYLKLSFLIGGLTSMALMFNAAMTSPEVEVSLDVELAKGLLQEAAKVDFETLKSRDKLIAKFKSATNKASLKKGEKEAITGGSRVDPKNPYVTIHKGNKWVLIQNKWYLYNPKNIYEVNGVRTYFDPKDFDPPSVRAAAKGKSFRQQALLSGIVHGGEETNTEKAMRNLDKILANPFSVYTPSGMKALKETIKAAGTNMKKRNEMLKQLSQAN